MPHKDKYDRMTPEKFHETLVGAIGGYDRAKMIIEKELLIVDKRLFTPAKEVIVLPPVERFSAKESFMIGEKDGVRIVHLGERFTNLFLGVVEFNVKESKVRRLELRKRTSSGRMLPNLGKRKFACIPLAHVHAFLKLVGEGSRDYLFFSACTNGGMWPIMADRSPDGWFIECTEFVRSKKRFDPGRIVVPLYREP